MIEYRTMGVDGVWDKIESRTFVGEEKIQRFLAEGIKKRFETNHVEVVIGPRQSGKTTLLLMLIAELLGRGIKRENIFYLNLDTAVDLSLFENPRLFVKSIEDLVKHGQRIYLFLDEVQRLKNPGLFFKAIYDLGRDIKIFVSGSSSLEVRSKVKEFLTGRKRETFLLPLSFREYFGKEKQLPGAHDLKRLDENSLAFWLENERVFGKYLAGKLEEMALFGGYPGVLNHSGKDERIGELAEIYNSYVKKDIIDFFKIERPDIFNNLVKALAAQAGNLLNKSEICSLIGCNMVTVGKYMDILKETYVTHYLPPLLSSRRSEIKSTHKCYFLDNGMRNFALRQFNPLDTNTDRGILIENLVFSELLKHLSLTDELFFWRSKAGAEMDFVLRCENGTLPIEIKAGSAIPGRLSRSFHAFLGHYSSAKALLINKDLFHIQQVNGTTVFYIPGHWFLLLGKEIIA